MNISLFLIKSHLYEGPLVWVQHIVTVAVAHWKVGNTCCPEVAGVRTVSPALWAVPSLPGACVGTAVRADAQDACHPPTHLSPHWGQVSHPLRRTPG